jgi:drug/metabolite transporter (DMT)-like permease
VYGKPKVRRSQVPLLFLCAVFLYGAQVAWITGLKMANPVVGSAWQPSQPIIVLLIAVLLRWETCTIGKTAGIFAALGGGLLMTLGAGASTESTGNPIVGNGFFALNCSSTALFIITMRVLTRSLPSQTAVAFIYCIASVGILITALLVSASKSAQTFLCPDCRPSFWYFPLGALPALFYWIFGSSVFAYAMLGFGTKHAKDATHCLAYTALQPVVAAVGETLLIVTDWNSRNPENTLHLPTWTQVGGAALIVTGVFFVILDALRPSERARRVPIQASLQVPEGSE